MDKRGCGVVSVKEFLWSLGDLSKPSEKTDFELAEERDLLRLQRMVSDKDRVLTATSTTR
jgi:hypothetical protein